MKPFTTHQIPTYGIWSPDGKKEYYITEPFIKLCDEDGRPVEIFPAHKVTPVKPLGEDEEGLYYAAPFVVTGIGAYSLFHDTPEIDVVDAPKDVLFEDYQPSMEDLEWLMQIQEKENG